MVKRVMSLVLGLGFSFGVLLGTPAMLLKAEEAKSEETSAPVEGEFSQEDSKSGTYTYRSATGASPLNWNPHSWETNSDNSVLSYTTDVFVEAIPDNDNEAFKFEFRTAESYDDITKDFDQKEKYGVKDDDVGRVWQVKIRKDLKWEDGTPINAHDFVESMKLLLDPARKNYRSNSFTSNEYELVNAKGYFDNDKAGQPIYVPVTKGEDGKYDEGDGKLFINLSENMTFFGGSATSYYEGDHKDKFTVDGTDLYEKYGKEWVEVTEEDHAPLLQLAKAFGDDNEEAWKEFCSYKNGTYEEVKWEDVGIFANDDYTFTLVFKKGNTKFYMYTAVVGDWLVKEEPYLALKEQKGDLVSTRYGTDLETSFSYGPYKLTSFEKDKQMIYERNENWFGYGLDQFKDQYQTSRVVVDVVSDKNTQKQLFLQGKIDDLSLTSEDLQTYGQSDRLYTRDLTYTFRYIFATSLPSLEALEKEEEGTNKRILHYTNFRKGISLALDRDRLCSESTPAYTPNFTLFSSLYFYDIENDPESVYKDSNAAKAAMCDFYHIEYGEGKDYATLEEAYDAITGYDVEAAKEAFQAAYDEAVKDGNYTDGQNINIRVMVGADKTLSPDAVRQQDLLNDFVSAATEGTPLAGKVNFKFLTGATNRYQDVALGKIEAIRGAWGGAAFYPFKNIQLYTSPTDMGGLEKIHESNGYDPTQTTLELTYDFNGDGTETTQKMNLEDWYFKMNTPGEPETDNVETRLYILSKLEEKVLSTYQCIPFGSMTEASLLSKKVDYGFQTYNIMTGRGGIRYLKFNYDDAAWVDYVKSQSGILNYE